jgi:deoxyribonuclease-4
MLIGHHISKKELLKCIKNNETRYSAYQFFASSPKTWANATDNPVVISKWHQTNNTYLVIHGKYLYNFCRKSEEQITTLTKELIYAAHIADDVNVIIHQGKNLKELDMTREEALLVFCDNIKSVLHKTHELSNKIILENSAHQGTEIGHSLEELAKIFNIIDSSRIGICIDLCHIFVAGELDMRDGRAVKLFFKKFDELIGLKHLLVIHYNDSRAKFDSHNDCHGDIGDGYIGKTELGGCTQGFATVIKIAKKHGIPMILETPECSSSFKQQIDFIRRL